MNRDSDRELTFAVKVIPRAKRDEIIGVEGDAVKVRLNAPPVEGRANDALIRFLAAQFGVKRADVEILRGETARHKLVRVRGATRAKLEEIVRGGKNGAS